MNTIGKFRNKVYVTKEFTFDCAHQLHNYDGECNQLHGHTYKLQVTMCGIPRDNGILIDFSNLKTIVEEAIINKLDHQNITEYFDENENGLNTTVENLVQWIYSRLVFCISYPPGVYLCKIKLWETPTCFAEYICGSSGD